jgi:hypothetical protein
MVQKKLRIPLAEAEPSETADTLRTLFPDATGGIDLTVVSTMATLVPTAKIILQHDDGHVRYRVHHQSPDFHLDFHRDLPRPN